MPNTARTTGRKLYEKKPKKIFASPIFRRITAGSADLHLPRPIHDKVGYENALEIAEAMAGWEERFTPDQDDYFGLLTDLIFAYAVEKSTKNLFPPGNRLFASG